MRRWRWRWRRGLKGNARQQEVLRLVDMPALVELERRVGVDLGVRLGSDGQAAVRDVQRLDRGAADLFARISWKNATQMSAMIVGLTWSSVWFAA